MDKTIKIHSCITSEQKHNLYCKLDALGKAYDYSKKIIDYSNPTDTNEQKLLLQMMNRIEDELNNIDRQSYKERKLSYETLIGRYWFVKNKDDKRLFVIYPYEMSGKPTPMIMSMLIHPFHENNRGYRCELHTHHANICDDIWAEELNFTEITEEEFRKYVHDDIDDVIDYRHWKEKQPKPNPQCIWQDQTKEKVPD